LIGGDGRVDESIMMILEGFENFFFPSLVEQVVKGTVRGIYQACSQGVWSGIAAKSAPIPMATTFSNVFHSDCQHGVSNERNTSNVCGHDLCSAELRPKIIRKVCILRL
jgi:hypothetical protein